MAELARAKVNLALHVTGRRADGYHLLDSLVVFPPLGDRVEAELPATGSAGHGSGHDAGLSLAIDGPFAIGLPADGDNLVLRAASLICPPGRGAALRLTKSLPVASGIGGGSADAAATLRELSRLWSVPLPDPAAILGLGADVPACLAQQPAIMRGIGEVLHPVGPLPDLWLVLANAGPAVPTAAVYRGLDTPANPPLPPLPVRPSADDLLGWLGRTRNDLQPPALALAPVVATVIDAIAATPGCRLARMSGSGGTCFGLYASSADALGAADALRARAPGWWVAAAPMR